MVLIRKIIEHRSNATVKASLSLSLICNSVKLDSRKISRPRTISFFVIGQLGPFFTLTWIPTSINFAQFSPRFVLFPSMILDYLISRLMAKSYFKQEHDLEKRKAEAARIREKYPDRIPVIVEKAERSDIPSIDKKKYLVPADLTVGQFVYVIRKRIKLSPEKAIFIFVDNVLPPTGAIMSAIYEEKKDEDGFLYVTYSGENTFGW
ncbi:unnamed protein product [Citrullus colocynthis]